jgi:hypothetical protein
MTSYALYDRWMWETSLRSKHILKPSPIEIMSEEEFKKSNWGPFTGAVYFAKRITDKEARKLRKQHQR